MSLHKPLILVAGKFVEIKASASRYIDPAVMGSGTLITTKYLRGDGTWQTVTATPAAGTVILIHRNETGASGTTTNTSAVTYTLAANTYSFIIAECEIGFVGVAATDCEATFNLTFNGGATKGDYALRQGNSGAGDQWKLLGRYSYSGVFTAGGAITMSVTATLGTGTWSVKSLRVYGVI